MGSQDPQCSSKLKSLKSSVKSILHRYESHSEFFLKLLRGSSNMSDFDVRSIMVGDVKAKCDQVTLFVKQLKVSVADDA